MNIIQQKELDLKITIGLVICAFGTFGFLNLYEAFSRHQNLILLLVMAGISIPIAIGLFFLNLQSLVFAQLLSYLGIAISIIDYISPFETGDIMAMGVEPPPAWRMLLNVIPIIIVLLWCLHIMGKYKGRFT